MTSESDREFAGGEVANDGSGDEFAGEFAGDEFDDEFDDDDDDGFDDELDDESADERGVELRIDEIEDRTTHLLRGEIEIEGRMPHSSNGTYLVHVVFDGKSHPAIYKPTAHERPLWDFERGLHRREVATYRLSEAMGLGVVPTTVLRDGPLGEGSLQWFVTGDFRHHYFTIHEAFPALHDNLRDIALLDVIANNTDRKSGHCVLAPGSTPDDDSVRTADAGTIDDAGNADDAGARAVDDSSVHGARVWGIDHGLTFAAEFKLRTVIWEFGGEPLDERQLDAVRRVHQSVPLDVAALLNDEEVAAIEQRAGWLLTQRELPTDPSGRRYPWPLV